MNKEKIVLIGAGSAMFTRGLVVDLIRKGWECDLSLVDIDEDALVSAEGVARKIIETTGSKVKLRVSLDRRDVLKGATSVICTIGVGGRRAWEKDVLIPRKYGIFQPVGDTIMPGGSSRALRMIPVMVEIAQDVMELAPNALFFNYGNPMSAVCRGVKKATKANMVGLCHGVFHVEKYLAQQLGVKHDRIQAAAMGINHLTWFTEFRVDGQDAFPLLKQIAREKVTQDLEGKDIGTSFMEAGTDKKGDVVDNPLSWQLFELFGAFPAVLDRHVAEFFPAMFKRKGSYFGKTLGVESYSFEKVIAWGDKIYNDMWDIATSKEPLKIEYIESISGEHEQATDIIEDIRFDRRRIYSVNIPNVGQVSNLPLGAVIECPGVTDATGITPIFQKELPASIVGTLTGKFMWVETIVEAALEGDLEKFKQALVLDGSVDSLIDASNLASELLEAQAKYLPQF